MRFIWLIFLGLAAAIGVVRWTKRPASPAPTEAAPATLMALNRPAPSAPARLTLSQALLPAVPSDAAGSRSVADSLVRFALRQLGVPYHWAGIAPETGFDCSGFLLYAYAHVGVPVPHSTALLISAGQPVPRAQARPGDLVVFTGTALSSTTPGHAGIIISSAGEVPLRFVHSSSARRESGVKISQVEGTDYERRFMQVRRVLGGAPTSGSANTPPTQAKATDPSQPARIAAILAPMEKRPAAVQVTDDAEPAPPPAHLTPLAFRKAVTKRRVSARTSIKAHSTATKPVMKARVRATSRRVISPKAGLKRVGKVVVKAPLKAGIKAKPKTQP